MAEPVPIVRCRLGGRSDEGATASLRYVPVAVFELWKHLMETRHGRIVQVEAVSVWIEEDASIWNSGFRADDLEPVLRVRVDLPGPFGIPVPVERFFPAETYPRAQEAWLGHLEGMPRQRVVATAGYVVDSRRLPTGVPSNSDEPSTVARGSSENAQGQSRMLKPRRTA